jgi:hypothetical protein
MKAIKLKVHIDSSRRLVIDLPQDLREGPAELIVLTLDREDGAAAVQTMSAHLEALLDKEGPGRPRAELDADLANERDSWA